MIFLLPPGLHNMPERKNSSSNKVFIHKNKVGHCTFFFKVMTSILWGFISKIPMLIFITYSSLIHIITLFFSLFSYGFMCGIGCAMVRDTSGLMLGQYFKRRREIVEFLSTMGIGFGIAIFSNVYHLGLG